MDIVGFLGIRLRARYCSHIPDFMSPHMGRVCELLLNLL
jgi:hypothetical protein